jgi:hypothetical protein
MPFASVIWILFTVIIVLVVAYVAKYVIDAFFPPPIQMPVLVLVGVVLLLIVLWAALGHFNTLPVR